MKCNFFYGCFLLGLAVNLPALTLPDSTVTIRFADGHTLQGNAHLVDSCNVLVHLNSEAAQQDSSSDSKGGRSRYLYAPSSFNLAAGEFQFSQKELLFSTLAYGLTDYVTLQVGSVVPALFVKGGENGLAAIKVGKMWDAGVGVHAGVEAFFVSGGYIGVPFVGTTFANNTSQLTFNYARAFTQSGLNQDGQVFNLAGSVRVSPRLSLLTEEYVIMADQSSTFLGSAALRFHASKILVDTGLFFMQAVAIPIPWVDFSLDF